MMTNTFIYGFYLGDGVCVHTYHYDEAQDGLPGSEGVWPLYSSDDDGTGLVCDRCNEYIFEPDEDQDDDDVEDDWEDLTVEDIDGPHLVEP